MISKAKLTGTLLAIGAATVFAMTPAVAAAAHDGKNVHCMGMNGCKGKSSCKTADNACKGKNSCKGKGFVSMSKSMCDQIGGTMS